MMNEKPLTQTAILRNHARESRDPTFALRVLLQAGGNVGAVQLTRLQIDHSEQTGISLNVEPTLGQSGQ